MKGQWGKLAGYFLGTLLVSSAITFGLPLLGGGSWLPDLISSEGDAIDKLFWGLTILSLVIFALVGAFIIYSVKHFRADAGDLSDGEHIHGNAKLEVAWIIIPSIIVFVIGVLSFMVMEDNEVGLWDKTASKRKGAAELAVDVRGYSFGWAFRYENVDGTPVSGDENALPSTELVLPVDKVVRFNVMSCSGKEHLGRIHRQVERELDAGDEESEFAEIKPGICEREWDQTTAEDQKKAEEDQKLLHTVADKRADGKDLSKEEQELWDAQPRFHGDDQFVDVNHGFWVPEARLKVDAVSGLRTYVQWKPTRTTGPDNDYQVVCAELCGSGHNGMRVDMCVVSQGTFDWWSKLAEDERRPATCVNLRLLNCIDEPGSRDDAIKAIAELTKNDPEAGCDEAEEAVA